MKWFHHECTAKHDPKLQELGEEFGAEGIGVYWGLLEEMGHHSDTFQIKVTGVSAESDRAYADALLHREGPLFSIRYLAGANVPRMPLKTLARILFTTGDKLQSVVEKLVEVGLFDDTRWRTYSLLYSPAFERRADDYTRRRRRSTDHIPTHTEHSRGNLDNPPAHVDHPLEIVGHESDSPLPRDDEFRRTMSAHTPNTLRRVSDTNREHCSNVTAHRRRMFPLEQTTEQKEIQKERQRKKEKEIEEEEKLCSIQAEFELSTAYPHHSVYKSDADTVLVPSAESFAVASTKQRIQSPFGWVWSCIHGTPEGMAPWVRLSTAPEEARRITSPISGATDRITSWSWRTRRRAAWRRRRCGAWRT